MRSKKVISCSDPNCNHGNGNLLLAFQNNRIFVKCRNSDCRRWTRLTLRIPGININLEEAGVVQEVMPEGYHLDLEKAMTVVGT